MVERCFGRIKKWKLLRYEHSIHYQPVHIFEIWSIIAACMNDFGEDLYSSDGLEQMKIDSERIMGKINVLNDIPTTEVLTTSGWKGLKIQRDYDFIPNYSLTSIRDFCTGIYVYNQAKAYNSHAKNVRFLKHRNHPFSLKVWGIKGKMSRNDTKSGGDYCVYFRFLKHRSLYAKNVISYCTCPNGAKTSGCCVHATAALYILWHHRNGVEIPLFNQRNDRNHSQCTDLHFWSAETAFADYDDFKNSVESPITDMNSNADMDVDSVSEGGDVDMTPNDLSTSSTTQQPSVPYSNSVDLTYVDSQNSSSVVVTENRLACGLRNPGVICYVNSALLLLFSLNSLRETVLRHYDFLPSDSFTRCLGETFKRLATSDEAFIPDAIIDKLDDIYNRNLRDHQVSLQI